jgi:hypothetical protein
VGFWGQPRGHCFDDPVVGCVLDPVEFLVYTGFELFFEVVVVGLFEDLHIFDVLHIQNHFIFRVREKNYWAACGTRRRSQN